MTPLILSESDLRDRVPLDMAAIAVVEAGFRRLAEGGVVMPPVMSIHLPEVNGEVDVKTAFVPGIEGFAVKISPGFFDNPALGLPSTSGMMVVLDAKTGRVRAVLLDNGWLTDVRTAAAGGVAARHLSRPDASRVAIMGAGLQARMQLQALRLVRPVTSAMIWARDLSRAQALADEVTGIDICATADAEEAVTQADIVVTTTPATQPILQADWLRDGQHVTAMGSDQPGKNELHPDCLARADLYVADRASQTCLMGELRAAIVAGTHSGNHVPELGDIIAGKHPGRTDREQTTICDLTGTGVQDTAIATHALAAFSKAT